MLAVKRLVFLAAPLVLLFACSDFSARSPEPVDAATPIGPNTQAANIVNAMRENDLESLRQDSTGLVAEYLDVLLDLARSRDQLCELLLAKLPPGADHDRVKRVEGASLDRVYGPWRDAELDGLIDAEGSLRRYRIRSTQVGGKNLERVMTLTSVAESWALQSIDSWPDLDTLIKVRNQENRVRFVIDGMLKRLAAEEVKTIDPECSGLLQVFESLKETL